MSGLNLSNLTLIQWRLMLMRRWRTRYFSISFVFHFMSSTCYRCLFFMTLDS